MGRVALGSGGPPETALWGAPGAPFNPETLWGRASLHGLTGEGPAGPGRPVKDESAGLGRNGSRVL